MLTLLAAFEVAVDAASVGIATAKQHNRSPRRCSQQPAKIKLLVTERSMG
jgi:hypothetical protein